MESIIEFIIPIMHSAQSEWVDNDNIPNSNGHRVNTTPGDRVDTNATISIHHSNDTYY